MKRDIKVCLVGSSGGHLTHLYMLKPFWHDKERPDLIISSGAAVAVPFFYVGKLYGAKLIYIEVFDRIDSSTVTGKLVYPITDRFIVEWEEMKKVYPKAINLGSIF